MHDTVLSKNTTAGRLSVSVRTLEKLAKQGLIQKIQVSERRVGFLESDVAAYLQSRRAPAVAEVAR